MKLRRFIIYSIVYLVLVTALAYSLVEVDKAGSAEKYFKFLDVAIFELPLVVWIVAPVGIFVLLSIFHIAYYGFSNYMFRRSIKRDEVLYKDLVREIFLGLDTNKDFKTQFYKIPSQITRILSPWQRYQDIVASDDELVEVINAVRLVNNGEMVDLKKFKLPKNNLLFIKNELNKIEKLPNYFLEILKNYRSIDDEISTKANEKLILNGSFADIKKFNFEKSADDVLTIISRFARDEINLSGDEISALLDNFKLSRENFNKIAVLLKSKLTPDALISIFEKTKLAHQDAEEAYIYVLFELQMLNKVNEILDMSDANEYQNFRILIYLRENGKSAPTDLFFK